MAASPTPPTDPDDLAEYLDRHGAGGNGDFLAAHLTPRKATAPTERVPRPAPGRPTGYTPPRVDLRASAGGRKSGGRQRH